MQTINEREAKYYNQTKRTRRAATAEALANRPQPATLEETCRRILDENAATVFHGQVIDLQSANVYILIHDALNDANRAHFRSMEPTAALELAWKLVSK